MPNPVLYAYTFRQLRVPMDGRGREDVILAQELGVPRAAIQDITIERLAMDSRRRGHPYWSYNVRFHSAKTIKHPSLQMAPPPENLEDMLGYGQYALPPKMHVVGAGPAGLWAALGLSERGYSVVLHEQGRPVEQRFGDIRKFFKGRQFLPHSNVLFGEGGAGAFSDGKLTTRNRGPLMRRVLEDLVAAGAPPEIVYLAKPHLGTDRMQFYLQALRQRMADAGVQIRFGSRLEDIDVQAGCLRRACFNGTWEECPGLVLATGHSARDIYQLLDGAGVPLQAKPFAMGVRVEHPQALIDLRQLGRGSHVAMCGAAEYALAAPESPEVKGAYSFCMCPGGVLIPCASEPGGFATNGMSYSRRNTVFANAGIIVPVEVTGDLWSGVQMQRDLESAAFAIGGGNYTAPAQTIASFLAGKVDSTLPKSSYPCGLVASDHNEWLPKALANSLRAAFLDYEGKIPGFIAQGLMVSPETRTSSPIRIPRRDDTMASIGVDGIFPLGEGAGYAGGIVTSAADGLRLAMLARPIAKGTL